MERSPLDTTKAEKEHFRKLADRMPRAESQARYRRQDATHQEYHQ